MLYLYAALASKLLVCYSLQTTVMQDQDQGQAPETGNILSRLIAASTAMVRLAVHIACNDRSSHATISVALFHPCLCCVLLVSVVPVKLTTPTNTSALDMLGSDTKNENKHCMQFSLSSTAADGVADQTTTTA